MTCHPLSKGTPVDLLLHGEVVMSGIVKSRRKVQSAKKVELFGEYDYYVVGDSFGTWWYSKDVREQIQQTTS